MRSNRWGRDVRYRKQMQIVSRLLAFTLDRWCLHRAAKKEHSTAAEEAAPSEVLPAAPPIKIGYEPFVLHSILLAQTLDNWTLS